MGGDRASLAMSEHRLTNNNEIHKIHKNQNKIQQILAMSEHRLTNACSLIF